MRADLYLVEKGMSSGRDKAGRMIEKGIVFIGGKRVEKKSEDIISGEIEIRGQECLYVSRGGIKLEFALEAFGVLPNGMICVDIGSSTGGFTDCLLRKGAERVYAVDCGSGQLAEEIRKNPRVISMENTNARYLKETDFDQKADIAVMDVSFISQTLLYGAIRKILKSEGVFISLIKPQFEAGRENVGKKGIVKDLKIHGRVIEKVKKEAALHGLECVKVIESPIKGGNGNMEYLALFKNSEKE